MYPFTPHYIIMVKGLFGVNFSSFSMTSAWHTPGSLAGDVTHYLLMLENENTQVVNQNLFWEIISVYVNK